MKHKPKHKTDARARALKDNLAKRKVQERTREAPAKDEPLTPNG